MSTPAPRWRLVDPDLLRTLMERTYTGSSIDIRQLADAVGVSSSHIGHLLTGETKTVTEDVAHRICAVIGVELLILWAPTKALVGTAEIPPRQAATA